MMDDTVTRAEAVEEQEYLLFAVDKINYGIDIGLVREILTVQPVSPIPNALPFCKGVINIRGTIVPVIDMRLKLGFAEVEYDERACIIVIILGGELVGIIVDAVQDVIRIAPTDLQESPINDNTTKMIRSYTSKIAVIGGEVKQILDINSLFDVDK